MRRFRRSHPIWRSMQMPPPSRRCSEEVTPPRRRQLQDFPRPIDSRTGPAPRRISLTAGVPQQCVRNARAWVPICSAAPADKFSGARAARRFASSTSVSTARLMSDPASARCSSAGNESIALSNKSTFPLSAPSSNSRIVGGGLLNRSGGSRSIRILAAATSCSLVECRRQLSTNSFSSSDNPFE